MESNRNPTFSNPASGADYLAAESDLLQVQHIYATQGQRFLNFLIDNILLRLGLSYLTGMALAYLLNIIAPDFLLRIAMSDSSWNLDIILLSLLIGYTNYIIY